MTVLSCGDYRELAKSQLDTGTQLETFQIHIFTKELGLADDIGRSQSDPKLISHELPNTSAEGNSVPIVGIRVRST